jgi:hypothetical protein
MVVDDHMTAANAKPSGGLEDAYVANPPHKQALTTPHATISFGQGVERTWHISKGQKP